MKKYVFMFNEVDLRNRDLFGGKGAILAEMTKLHLPVPQGFVVSTEMCTRYYEENCTLDDSFLKQVKQKVLKLEKKTGKAFGSYSRPLMVSVRSGARVSMPGMMDTVVNIGMNDYVAESMQDLYGEEFAYDTYARLIVCFADYVMKHDRSKYDEIAKTTTNKKELTKKFKELYKTIQGEDFPQDPEKQLFEAIKGVFSSWENERANIYRKTHNIPYEWGTAVTVQEMVFGNLSQGSGTGRLFSRNPMTGENVFYGEYMPNAQGEDLFWHKDQRTAILDFEKKYPKLYDELTAITKRLERHYKDIQEVEFTHQNNKLYILQTRNRKHTAAAAIKSAYDFVQEGICDEKTALLNIKADLLKDLFKDGVLTDKSIAKELDIVLSWADKYRTLKIMANAVTGEDAKHAFSFGAEGVGICRTEDLFESETAQKTLKSALAGGKNAENALAKFVGYQEKEFEDLFRAALGKQVTIRLLDDVSMQSKQEEKLAELGTRGARLAINTPEIAKAQVEAIIKAAIKVQKEYEIDVVPEIMVPFVCDAAEFKRVKDMISARANALIEREGIELSYRIGTMIEVPRAAIVANELAKYADFFSFGMNDLTQLTYGCSRFDKDTIFDKYYKERIFEEDPFEKIDQNGVGKFVRIAVELAKATRKGIKLGFCSDQAGDPSSIEYAHRVGLTYISCVPDRIALAKISAAQAAIRYPRRSGLFGLKRG